RGVGRGWPGGEGAGGRASAPELRPSAVSPPAVRNSRRVADAAVVREIIATSRHKRCACSIVAGRRRAGQTENGGTRPYFGITGAMIREACCLSWYTVFFATTVISGKSIVSASPVFGFGSKNGAPVLATVTRMRCPLLKTILVHPTSNFPAYTLPASMKTSFSYPSR